MRKQFLLVLGLALPLFTFCQIPDSIALIISKYEGMQQPARIDSIYKELGSHRLPAKVYMPIINAELKDAEAHQASPFAIATIQSYKMRIQAALLELGELSKTISSLQEIIHSHGDLKQKEWKVLQGNTHIFSAYVSSAQYLHKEAIVELGKAIEIFETLKPGNSLSECYLDMYIYLTDENNKKEAQKYLQKLEALAEVMPLNSIIVSSYIHKMAILADQRKFEELQQMVDENKDSIMFYAPWYEFEIKNNTAIVAMNLNNYQTAYDIYKPMVDEINNKKSSVDIRGQVETVTQYCTLLRKMNRFEAATICQDTLVSLLNTQYTIFRDDAITESKAKYNKLEDEKKIQELESETQLTQARFRNILMGLFSFIALTIGGFIFWRSRQKQKEKQGFLLAAKEKEAQKVREKLLTSITHELRTPLAIISAKLDSLENTKTQDAKAEHLTVAKRNTKQLVDQINQLLDWNKLEANALTNLPTTGDVEHVMEQTLDEIKPYASFKKIEWNLGVKEQNFNGKLDFSKFQTIARNLLSNAIKYSPVNALIQLRLYQENNNLVFSVQDAGPGIPAQDLSKIFDWYYRVSSENKEGHYEGFGIGLALSKELAELMGGTLTAESSQEKGSTFTLKVPFEVLQGKDQLPAQAAILQDANSRQRITKTDDTSLLIIEDNPDLAHHIASLFQEEYEVLSAYNLKQGKQLAEQEVPDIIISDVMLPDGNGLDLCKQLKSHLVTNHIPILVLTAKAGKETRFSSLKTGADAFLNKPFNNQELQLTVKNLLQNRRRLHLKFGNRTEEPSASPDRFSEMVLDILNVHYSNSQFTLDKFAKELNLSKTQAYKKFRATFNNTPANLLREFRLEKAKQLLAQKDFKIAEVAYACGFTSPEYFSTVFKEFFKQTPSEYRM